MKLQKIIRGRIVTPTDTFLGEVGVADGVIKEIAKGTGNWETAEVLDYGTDYVFPGFIDTHVHIFSNPNEGIERASRASAKGGITTMMDMPYDLPTPVTSTEVLNQKIAAINSGSIVDIALWGTVPKENGAEVVDDLVEAGVSAFKLSTFETDPYRFPRISDIDIIKTMEKTKTHDIVIAFHAENDELLNNYMEEAESNGNIEPIYHNLTRPPVTETTAILKLLDMADWTGSKLHIVHVSHAKSIDYIRSFKDMGTDVTAETCYNYLMLTTKDLREHGPKAKINPPLRTPDESDELEKRLLEGAIDFITSDHAPWQKEDKSIGDSNIFKAKSGTPGLEIMIPLLFDHLVKDLNMKPHRFAELLSFNPSKRFKFDSKGSIEVGKDADFTVIKENAEWRIDESNFISVADVSPYHGKKVSNRVESTILKGEVIYTDSTGVTDFQTGSFLKPGTNRDVSREDG